jgi:GNAT superfamily N-acetyltransferase
MESDTGGAESISTQMVEKPLGAHPLYHVECEQTGWSHRIVLFESGEKPKRPLGKIIFTMSKDGVMHIDNLWVSEAIRGGGMGHVLLEQAIATAAELGATRVLLEAEEDTRRHDKLVQFYREKGFEQIGNDSNIQYLYNGDECFRKVPMETILKVISQHSSDI